MTITNGYATLLELKERLFPTGLSDTHDDPALEQVITGVSRWIDAYCRRRFYAASETRYFTAADRKLCFVEDLLTVTTLSTDEDGDRTYETTWTATDYDLEPYNAALEGQAAPYTHIRVAPNGTHYFPSTRKGVKIVGSFGYASTTPPLVKEACLLQSIRTFKRKDAPFGVAGSAEMGQLVVIPKLDPDVAMMLRSLRKVSV